MDREPERWPHHYRIKGEDYAFLLGVIGNVEPPRVDLISADDGFPDLMRGWGPGVVIEKGDVAEAHRQATLKLERLIGFGS